MKKFISIMLVLLLCFCTGMSMVTVCAEDTVIDSTLVFLEDNFNEATLDSNYKSDKAKKNSAFTKSTVVISH